MVGDVPAQRQVVEPLFVLHPLCPAPPVLSKLDEGIELQLLTEMTHSDMKLDDGVRLVRP